MFDPLAKAGDAQLRFIVDIGLEKPMDSFFGVTGSSVSLSFAPSCWLSFILTILNGIELRCACLNISN